MRLTAEFADCYRFYQALLLPFRNSGYFIPCQELPAVGEELTLAVRIAVPAANLELPARVVGRRPSSSSSLQAGISVVLGHEGQALARQQLEAAGGSKDPVHLRSAIRHPATITIGVVKPFLPQKLQTLDVSRGGVRLLMPPRFKVGTMLTVELDLPGRSVEREAQLVWQDVVHGRNQAGLRFGRPLDLREDELRALVAPASASAPARQRILVADDDPAVGRFLADGLGRMGFQVHVVTSGPETISAAREVAPQLLMIDVLMPGMDGFSVLAALRRDAQMARLPIILMSAMDEREVQDSVKRVGAAAYLSKPFRLEMLETVVGAIMAGQARAAAS